jgi:uncharacterized membrane protein
MLDFIRNYQKIIGLIFIAAAIFLFADKAVDLGAEAVPLLGEVMIGIVLFAVGYVFVVQSAGRKETDKDDTTDS